MGMGRMIMAPPMMRQKAGGQKNECAEYPDNAFPVNLVD